MAGRIPSERLLTGAYVLAMSMALAPAIVGPVWDHDFWYHLASGRYMIEGRALIHEDPFNYTTSLADVGSVYLDNLRGYWLAQLLMYLSYMVGGFYGVIALRAGLILLALGLAYAWGRGRGASHAAMLGLCLLVGPMMHHFTGDRPQLFSFVFTPALLMTLEAGAGRLGRGGWRGDAGLGLRGMALPALMALWANCHRGYPLGLALMAVYLAAEALQRREFLSPHMRRLALWTAVSALAAGLNPNGYRTIWLMFAYEGSWLQAAASEYKSPLAMFMEGKLLPAYWGYLALSAGALALGVARGRARLQSALVTAFLLLISLSAFRYIPYFMLGTMAYAGEALTPAGVGAGVGAAGFRRGEALGHAVSIALIATLGWTSLTYTEGYRWLAKSPVAEGMYPVRAAQFYEESEPRGNLLNYWGWGGYIMWTLGPEVQVFADTRTLNPVALEDYRVMMHGPWEEAAPLLERYDIGVVLMPGVDRYGGGREFPLLNHLAGSPAWRLVFYDEQAVTFVREAGNEAYAGRRYLPRGFAYWHLAAQARVLERTLGPESGRPFAALARAATAKRDALIRADMLRAYQGGDAGLREAFGRAGSSGTHRDQAGD